MDSNNNIIDGYSTSTSTSSTNTSTNHEVCIEKKKRGRKKMIKPEVVLSNFSNDGEATTLPEKKIRKRRSKKNIIIANGLGGENNGMNTATDGTIDGTIDGTNINVEVVSNVKVRKRRVCKSKNADTNVIIDQNNPNSPDTPHPVEEKVVKKRGRKPKGGKIITQKLEENNNNNEMPNIILHLKCSLNDIGDKNSEKPNCNKLEESGIESYNNLSQLKGSDICNKNTQANAELKNVSNIGESCTVYNDSLSHLFKVYNPTILSTDSTNSVTTVNKNTATTISHSNANANANVPCYTSNEILNNRTCLFNGVYSPDVNLYGNEYDECDEGDSITGICKNEKEIWRKINQLKVSFHKSDICKNIGGTQRSACFWCTCEFDSPAVYIPKNLTKDVYNVYGCFCSPECSAAFLMNENIDTSTKFERYHLLNLLYGKIYKYEKSIKIAPNPFYLLNKFCGNLTIQEYRKLFQSEQMIYIVNKPLTHILPELYEDNNDFLLNRKIIPTNSVNIKKNKPLKSNIINNAFGITAGGN